MKYTLQELVAMDNDTLRKAAKQAFSMQFDPFSELGQRTIKKRLDEVKAARQAYLSPAVATIIGFAATIIESILNYQEMH